MRLSRLPRYATIVTAAIASLALVAATAAAAPASAGRSHSAQSCNSVGALCWIRVNGVAIPREGPLPKGAPPIAGTITVDLAKEFPQSRTVSAIPKGTVLGYFFCLRNAPKSCIGEDRGESNTSTHQVLSWIASAIGGGAVWAALVQIVKAAKNSWQAKVTGEFNDHDNYGTVEPDPQDGWCFQDWEDPGLDILAACNEDGDYFQFHDESGGGELIYDTYTGAVSHVYCNCEDETVIESEPVDWFTWELWKLGDGDTNSVTLSPWYAKAMAADARAHRKDLAKAG
jgi:hypothetical protein